MTMRMIVLFSFFAFLITIFGWYVVLSVNIIHIIIEHNYALFQITTIVCISEFWDKIATNYEWIWNVSCHHFYISLYIFCINIEEVGMWAEYNHVLLPCCTSNHFDISPATWVLMFMMQWITYAENSMSVLVSPCLWCWTQRPYCNLCNSCYDLHCTHCI